MVGRVFEMQARGDTIDFGADAVILIDKAVAGFQVKESGCLHVA